MSNNNTATDPIIIVYFSEGFADRAERVPASQVEGIRRGYQVGCDIYGGGDFSVNIWDEENKCFIDDDPDFELSEKEIESGIVEVNRLKNLDHLFQIIEKCQLKK